MSKLRSLAFLALAVVFSSQLHAEDAKKKELDLKGIKCIFCKMQVKEDVAVDYKGGKVYLGCAGCSAGFEKAVKSDEVVAAKANWQLVATKQAKQKGCPMSGGDVDKKMFVKVKAGDDVAAKVSFCCGKCKAAAEKMEGDKQLVALFGEKVFKKTYEVKKSAKKKTEVK